MEDEEKKDEFDMQVKLDNEEKAERKNQRCRCWMSVIYNPEMTDKEFLSYLQDLYNEDYLKYAMFQREAGEENGTIHFQLFLDFKNARTFKWVKDKFKEAHLEPMRGTKAQCRDYCSKPDTRVSGPYEVGEFIEERSRTDLLKICEMLKAGISLDEIQAIYPTQCLMYSRQLKDFAQNIINKDCKNRLRDIKVTYIYGPAGTGKTSYMYQQLGFENTFCVDMYDNSMFTHYNNEKNIVFDEFTGKIDITYMNKLLDRYPVQLRGLNTVKYANFDEIYIISNLPLSAQYTKIQEEQPVIYKAFLRRIGRIIKFESLGKMQIEKDVYNKNHQIEIVETNQDLPFDDGNLDF